MVSSSEAALRAQARREIEAQELDAKFAAVEAVGRQEFGSRWYQAKHNLSMLEDGTKIPTEILQAALEVDDPALTLLELSKDLDKAQQLMELPPLQRVIAVNRLAPVSREHRQPRTLSRVASDGQRDQPSDRDSDEEWNRKEDVRERKLRELRRGTR